MKRIYLLSALSILTVFAMAAEEALTVKTLLQKADVWDTKAVFVKGKISDFQQKMSRKGNAYFTFKLKEDDKTVNGYSYGEKKPPLKEGDNVEVRGIFRKSKKVGDFTVTNEIDVSPVKEKPYGVTKVD